MLTLTRVFQIVVRIGGIPPVGGNWKFCCGKFLPGGGNLRRSDFDQKLKITFYEY